MQTSFPDRTSGLSTYFR